MLNVIFTRVNPIILITGATSGIGKAAAEKFAQNHFNLIITGRRKDRLERIESSLKKKIGIQVFSLCFDIRKREEVDRAIESLPAEWKNISILLNNAGLAAGFDKFQDGDIDNWEQMIDTNVKGLLYITRKIVPQMIQNKSGHIINIGSTAGKEVYLKGNVYCATKFAVDAITRTMRIDLLEQGIKVTSINPGMAETEFSLVRFNGDAEKAKHVYKGFKPLSAEDVAEVIYFAANQPAHVNLNDIIITATSQANSIYTHRENN